MEMPSQQVVIHYNGQKVLTTGQIAESFNCHSGSIRDILRYHKNEFTLGADYFFLEGLELKKFKAEFRVLARKNSLLPFSMLANRLYLWTESGFEKLAKYLTTDTAKLTHSALIFGCFQQSPKVEEAQEKFLCAFTPHEKVTRLFTIAELTTDEKLREKCLRLIFEIVK